MTALSASYAGFAIDLAQEFALTAAKIAPSQGIESKECDKLDPILDKILKAGDLLFRVLANPSVKRLSELLETLREASSEAEDLMAEAEHTYVAALVGKLHDIARLLIIASYVALCRVLNGMTKVREPEEVSPP